MIDPYERKARVYPALVVGLPCALLGIAIGVTETAWWPTISGAVVGSGFFVVAAQIGRHTGKKKEAQLFESWGGKPTTRLLRHAAGVNPVRLDRIHGQLEALTGMSMPTADAESADPSRADDVYETVVGVLRDRTRNPRKFPLVFKELCNYGFRRNLWGLRPWGVTINLAVAILSAVWLWIGAEDIVAIREGGATFVLLASLGMAIAWWVLVTPRWVEQTAIAYAERMMDAVEHLTAGTDEEGERHDPATADRTSHGRTSGPALQRER